MTKTKEQILEDLLSDDVQRVWSSSWEVVKTWDTSTLSYLIANKDSVQKVFGEMKGVGHFGGDRDALEKAIEKLAFCEAKPSCLCEFYTKNFSFDPTKEKAAGHVTIFAKNAESLSGAICECLVCQKRYEIEEAEYHSTIWRWTLVAP